MCKHSESSKKGLRAIGTLGILSLCAVQAQAAKGCNNGNTWDVNKTKAYAPGKSGTVKIKDNYNCWKITLTGNTVEKPKKKCIAWGKISE